MDSSDATDKPVDVIQSGSNGSCFEEVFAGEDIGLRLFEAASRGDHAADQFKMVGQVGANVATEYDVTVVLHPEVIDRDGEVAEVFPECGEIRLLLILYILEEQAHLAVRHVGKILRRAVGVDTAFLPTVAGFPIGNERDMAEFTAALMIAEIELAVVDHGAADRVAQVQKDDRAVLFHIPPLGEASSVCIVDQAEWERDVRLQFLIQISGSSQTAGRADGSAVFVDDRSQTDAEPEDLFLVDFIPFDEGTDQLAERRIIIEAVGIAMTDSVIVKNICVHVNCNKADMVRSNIKADRDPGVLHTGNCSGLSAAGGFEGVLVGDQSHAAQGIQVLVDRRHTELQVGGNILLGYFRVLINISVDLITVDLFNRDSGGHARSFLISFAKALSETGQHLYYTKK